MSEDLRSLSALDEIAAPYAAIFSDVWGVVHNGARAFPRACAALKRARDDGKAVVLVTNAPRPSAIVAGHLDRLGVPRDAWDRIVSSGDVTRELIAEGPRRVFHVGSDDDLAIYDGLDVELVEEFEAQAVVCTGLVDDATETPEDYRDLLVRLRARGLPFVCANPDIVVEHGDRLQWCAGALARDYAQMGGRTLIAGKPHAPIYARALAEASAIAGRDLEPSQVLAIGDGLFTDVKGAVMNDIDVLFVTEGIHAAEFGSGDAPDPARLQAFLATHGHWPVAYIPRLA